MRLVCYSYSFVNIIEFHSCFNLFYFFLKDGIYIEMCHGIYLVMHVSNPIQYIVHDSYGSSGKMKVQRANKTILFPHSAPLAGDKMEMKSFLSSLYI